MKKTGHIISILFRIALLCGLVYVYIGFYSPDPYAMGRWVPYSQLLVMALRLGIPLFILGIVALVTAIRNGRIALTNVWLTLGTIAVCLLVIAPFAKARFDRMMANRRGNHTYHPYLQLAPPLPESRSDSDCTRIFCLGGSTTEWTDADGRGWPVRLEALLNRDGADTVRVENLGRQWYTTQHTLINYAVNLRPTRPDVILVMHTINDLLHNADFCYFSFGPFRNDYGHFYGPVSRVMQKKSALRRGLDLLGHFWYHTPRKVVVQDTFPGLAVFEQNLHSLIDLAEKDGVRVILMTQPNLYKSDITDEELHQLDMLNHEAIGETKKWDYQTAFEGFRQYTDVVRHVAADRQVALIDLEVAIPKTLAYFKDDVHYREKGYDRVAEVIADAILKD